MNNAFLQSTPMYVWILDIYITGIGYVHLFHFTLSIQYIIHLTLTIVRARLMDCLLTNTALCKLCVWIEPEEQKKQYWTAKTTAYITCTCNNLCAPQDQEIPGQSRKEAYPKAFILCVHFPPMQKTNAWGRGYLANRNMQE